MQYTAAAALKIDFSNALENLQIMMINIVYLATAYINDATHIPDAET